MNKRELQIEITKIMDRLIREKTLNVDERTNLEKAVAELRQEMKLQISMTDTLVDLLVGAIGKEIDEKEESKPVKKKAKANK